MMLVLLMLGATPPASTVRHLGRDFFGSGSRDRRFEIHDGVKNDPDHQLMVGQLTPAADAKASGEFILKGMNSQLTGNVENDRQRLRYAIAYNVTTLVPTVVRVNWEAARAGGVFDDGGRIELRLTKDAAATPAP